MRRALAAALAFVLILLTACTEAAPAETKTITQIDGTAIEVPLQSERLAAVYGPSYEALVVLGAEDKIVVRADVQTDNFPWASVVFSRIDSLPYLENVHSSVNTEELLTYGPDLVFTFSRPNELNQLEKAGIAAVPGLTGDNLDDVKNQLMVYAQALGDDAVARAQAYADYFDEKLAQITAVTDTIPESERPSVYYAGVDMLTTYGKYSDIPELIEAAGGRAVTKDLEAGNRTQINFEQLVAWNPDYIFIDHGGMNEGETVEQILNDTYSDGRYSAITAVAQGQMVLTPSGVFYWDMGLQKILLLMYMAKTLHPDLFASLDMAEEIMGFYQTFFDYSLTRQKAEQILNRQDPS